MKDNPFKHYCPVCNAPAIVTRTWTKDKSGKKYEYKLFHHNNSIHRVRENSSASGRIPKNDARRELLVLLNSVRFRKAIFTVREVVEAVNKGKLSMRYPQVSRILLAFVEAKFILVLRRGRMLYFTNTPVKGKLDYLFKDISIELNDSDGTGLFKEHRYKARILNDSQFPLSYLQYRVFGDNAKDKDQTAIRAYDTTNNERAHVYYLEDNPKEKRIIIEFVPPVSPGEEREFQIDYSWPELEPSYTFTAATDLKSLRFLLFSEVKFALSVTKTNQNQTEAEAVYGKVTFMRDGRKRMVSKFEDTNIRPFVILKFKWEPDESDQSRKERHQLEAIS